MAGVERTFECTDQSWIKGRSLKKRENVGFFPKSGTGNDMFVRKNNYGLFCILGP